MACPLALLAARRGAQQGQGREHAAVVVLELAVGEGAQIAEAAQRRAIVERPFGREAVAARGGGIQRQIAHGGAAGARRGLIAGFQRHPAIGAESIERAEKALGVEFEFLQLAKEIAHYHHKKWDGSGYPEGLAGKAIPLSARLMALADVYDALISKRVYKEAFSHEKALSIIAEGRGTHFDPLLLDTLLRIEGQFREIAATYADD